MKTAYKILLYQDHTFSKDPSLNLDTINKKNALRETFTDYFAIITESMAKLRNPTENAMKTEHCQT